MFTRIHLSLVVAAASLFALSCGESEKAEPSRAEPSPEEIPKGDAGRRMYFEKRCDSGHAGMCGELALMWAKGWGGEKSKEKADALYRRACDGGVPAACEKIGRDLSGKEQLKILEKNCAGGVAFACNNLGHLLWIGKDVERDPARARDILSKGCDGGFSASCRALVKLYGKGIGGEKDEETARKWSEKEKAAALAEEAMELKYLHAKPMSQRPVGHARPSLIEARKRKAEEASELNKNMVEERINRARSKAGAAPGGPEKP